MVKRIRSDQRFRDSVVQFPAVGGFGPLSGKTNRVCEMFGRMLLPFFFGALGVLIAGFAFGVERLFCWFIVLAVNVR